MADRSVTHRGVSRRAFLKGVGVATGAMALAAGGGLVWRAVDQSVLAPGTGAAYEPWQFELDGPPPLSLVAAAILAASAHNTQPWLFSIRSDAIDLFADRRRSIGSMDPLGRELHLSLGCAVENLVLAARAHGLEPTVSLLPSANVPDHIASITLAPGAPTSSALYRAIPQRHTNRAAYDVARPVGRSDLDDLAGLSDDPSVAIAWVTERDAMVRFGRLTVDATRAILADPEQARDDFAWYRQDWHDIQRQRDGITLDASGLGEPIRTLVRLLPASSQRQMQDGWLDATRDRHVATAAAFGLVVVRDAQDPRQLARAGRLFQRAHLFATTRGLAVQPLNQVLERADREATSAVGSEFTTGMHALTPAGWQTVMAFRIGYPTASPGPSPRRAVNQVIQG